MNVPQKERWIWQRRQYFLKIQKVFHWVKKDLDPRLSSWPVIYDVKANLSPFQLFFQLFDDEFICIFVQFSNQYACKKNKTGNVSNQGMKSFFGILSLSGYVLLPRRHMFWENLVDTRNELVTTGVPPRKSVLTKRDE